jgi:hypothetical protein
MARFTTRVELHKATDSDYEDLHKYMAAKGFSRTITSGDDETKYRLPPAEYNRETDATRAKVLDDAKAAAAKTGRTNEILVTESAGRSWHNLTPVK